VIVPAPRVKCDQQCTLDTFSLPPDIGYAASSRWGRTDPSRADASARAASQLLLAEGHTQRPSSAQTLRNLATLGLRTFALEESVQNLAKRSAFARFSLCVYPLPRSSAPRAFCNFAAQNELPGSSLRSPTRSIRSGNTVQQGQCAAPSPETSLRSAFG